MTLNTDTSDCNAYCEEHKPKDHLCLSQEAIVKVIAARNQGTTPVIEEELVADDVITVKPVVTKVLEDIDVSSITFGVTKQTKPEVDFGYDELNRKLDLALKKYDGLVVTEKNLGPARIDKKTLTDLAKTADRFRIDEKKILLEPITEMEIKLKSIVEKINSVLLPIKAGIQVFTDKKNDEQLLKVETWVIKAYEVHGLREEFQTFEYTHTTKKKDVESAVMAGKALQNQTDTAETNRLAQIETDKIFIKQQVKQANEMFGTELNDQDYINQYDNGTTTLQIGSNISKDAQNILAQADRLAQKIINEAAIVADSNKAHGIKAPGIVHNGEKYNEDTGEHEGSAENLFDGQEQSQDVEVQIEEPEEIKYKFIIEITGTFEGAKAFSEWLATSGLEYNQLSYEEVKNNGIKK